MLSNDAAILVVDDAVTMRALIKDYLKKMGYSNIFEARNVEEATQTFERLESQGVRLEFVFADMNMPGGTGIDFLKKIRALPQGKNLPFVMITTEGEMNTVTEAVMNGVSGYLLKPVTQPALMEKMVEAYKKHHQEKL
ncbi:MAG: response regulator [Bdellovibrionales bacterium CG10_big_fil_rev_8_21_14_0_10_45_34]|nr:MAG: response regulator [Bdellovibrionales bacterium CG10_big_fil_rev_8_21_14_0_10_45_34]